VDGFSLFFQFLERRPSHESSERRLSLQVHGPEFIHVKQVPMRLHNRQSICLASRCLARTFGLGNVSLMSLTPFLVPSSRLTASRPVVLSFYLQDSILGMVPASFLVRERFLLFPVLAITFYPSGRSLESDSFFCFIVPLPFLAWSFFIPLGSVAGSPLPTELFSTSAPCGFFIPIRQLAHRWRSGQHRSSFPITSPAFFLVNTSLIHPADSFVTVQ